MKVIRDKSINKQRDTLNFDVISHDNAIIVKTRDDDYTKQFNLVDIAEGLTLQNNQFYYFTHDIVNTPHTARYRDTRDIFSYKVYPISNELANKLIYEKYLPNTWEMFFDVFSNNKKIYIVVKNWDIDCYSYSAKIEDDKLIIPYGISSSDMKDEQTIEEILENHANRYNSMFRAYIPKETDLQYNLDILRDIKLKELL